MSIFERQATKRPESGQLLGKEPECGRMDAQEQLLVDIVDYALSYEVRSAAAYETAYHCLMDSVACALQALRYPACARLLGPIVPGASMPGGARVPGTSYELDPVQAAFNLGTMIRWLDANDTWVACEREGATECGHPSDSLGGILAVADYLSRKNAAQGKQLLTVRDVFTAMIKAHEIQRVLALESALCGVGLDQALLVRLAATAVTAVMLGVAREAVVNALSNAWLDGGALRADRQSPHTGPRTSWATADATSRGVWHALIASKDVLGGPTTLTAPTCGFQDVSFQGQAVAKARSFGSYAMENVLFKHSFPADLHGQTAVEASLALQGTIKDRLDRIERIVIETQEAGMRMSDNAGPLASPADRENCLQYMVAVALLFGRHEAGCYEDSVASDPRIERLRSKILVRENTAFTEQYYAADMRYIGNAVQVFFDDGTSSERVVVDCPIGHRRRRSEGAPLLIKRFEAAVAAHFSSKQTDSIKALFADRTKLERLSVNEFLSALVKN